MKYVKRVLLCILLIVIIIASVFLLNGYNMYQKALEGTTLSDTIDSIRKDKNYITLENLPKDYYNAVIAVEDHRFKEHGAIDLIAIGRAFYVNIKNMKLLEGGSTITQQTAKNIFFITEDDPITRKIAEIFAAIDLEKNYSKDDILELYINTIYFGDGYYGIKEACKGYLDKNPSKMDLYDASMMAGIPNAPSVYAPTVNPELTKSRQKKVLSDMVEYGYISQEEANIVLDKLK